MALFLILLNTCRSNAERIALVCDNVSLTYKELLYLVKAIGQKMQKNGVEKGHKVGLIVENPVDFVIVFFAICYCDAIVMPLFCKTANAKIDEMINEYEINHLVFATKSTYSSDKLNKMNITVDNWSYIHYVNIKHKEIDWELDEVKLILFSSGTTNIPKAIMLSAENVLSNVEAIGQYLRLTQEDKLLLVKNMNHASSIVGEMLVGIDNACTLYFSTKLPTPNLIMRLISDNEITIFFAVPTILLGIIENDKFEHFNFKNLRIINFYGAKMSQQNILNLCKGFPEVNTIYSYGLSEASPRVTYIERNDFLTHLGSSGRPIKDVNVGIRDDNDGVVGGNNIIGEITVTGPNVMKGYYKRPELTSRVIRNNVLYTGDFGYLDDDGFLYVTGRRDNMIINAGKNIYPEELEGVLTNIPDVLEALVIGCEAENGTVLLEYYVVLKENSRVDEIYIFNHCRDYLELYKLPSKIYFLDVLEKTPSGKIKRSIKYLHKN